MTGAVIVVDTLLAPLAGRGSRVLVTSINYPPEHAGIGPYVGEIAEHLAVTGYAVRVITGVPHYPAWSCSPEYRTFRTDELRNGVHVTRMRHHVPARQTALRRGAYEASFLANAARVRPELAPDVVLSVSPSLSAAVVGQRLARRFRVPNVLFVQDLMGAAARQSGIAQGGRVARVTDRIEAGIVRRADRIAVPHECFRDRLVALGAAPGAVHVVPNWTHIAAAGGVREQTRARLGWTGRHVSLHAGNMGVKQGLEVVVEAARAASGDPRLLFVLLGEGSQRARLRELGGSLPNLAFLDPVPDADFPDVLNAADALLLTQRASVLDMSLPSKLTSYFAAGRPVVASVAAGGGTAAEVRRAAGGVTVTPEDGPALVRALQALAADPVQADALGSAGRRYALEHLDRAASLARLDALLGLGIVGATA